MVQYTDSQGVVYTISPKYENGDIIILDKDAEVAWRVDKEVLPEASPVFKGMFSCGSINGTTPELRFPDAEADDIHLLVRALNGKPAPEGATLTNVSGAIELAIQYECIDIAKALLFQSSRDLPPDEIFDAFVLASRLNDLITGCRILAQGYKTFGPNKQPIAKPLWPVHFRQWKIEEAQALRSEWIWALISATETCAMRMIECVADQSGRRDFGDIYAVDRPGGNQQLSHKLRALADATHADFWRMVVGEFIVTLLK